MSAANVPIYVQPALQMSASTAKKIADGTAYRIGGVVRDVATKQLVEMLSDAPVQKVATKSAKKAASVGSKLSLAKVDLTKVDLKTVGAVGGGLVLLGGAAVGGYLMVKQLKGSKPAAEIVEEIAADTEQDPECLVSFRASLKHYVDAGLERRLTPEIVGELVADLAAVEEYASGGAVVFTFDELMPFFELVTAHTPVLASAFEVEVDERMVKGANVVSLRRHLEIQQNILAGVA